MADEDTEDFSSLLLTVMNRHLYRVKSLVSQGANVNEGNAESWTPLAIASISGKVEVDMLVYLLDQQAKVRKSVKRQTSLHVAAFHGHLDAIKYLINQGAEVNKGDNDGWTALHIAARNGHFYVVKYLIRQGAEVNKGNNNDISALHIAAQNCYLSVVKYLIRVGAEVNKGDINGRIPLHSAAWNGHLDASKILISQGAEVNKGENKGWTALHLAAQNGHLDICTCLISQGAEVNKGENEGWTALHIASRNGDIDVVKYLISQKAETNKGNDNDDTALHVAAQNGHLDVCTCLISQGAKVNKDDNNGWTALHIAAENGHIDVVIYLISQGAEVNKVNNNTVSALHIAARKGNLDVTKYLINQKGDVKKEDNNGRTALHLAAQSGHLDVCTCLISQGAEVNKGDSNGSTALHNAGYYGHLDVSNYLISQGAEVNKGANNGRTTLHIAAQNGHLDVVKYLISQRAEVNKRNNNGWTALHTAARKGHLDVVQYLISQRAEVNKGDSDGWSALHIAARNGHLHVVEYLISHGAEVNEGNKNDVIALHITALNGLLDVVKYLISQGAEVNKGDNRGWTALHTAARNGHLDVVIYLIKQGAEVNKEDNRGCTALHFSNHNDHLDVSKYLISQGAVPNRYRDVQTLLKGAAEGVNLDETKSITKQEVKEDIFRAIHNGDTPIIERLVSSGVDLNARATDGKTCLHKAIKLCYVTDRIVQETDTLKRISDGVFEGKLSSERALVFYLLENGAKTDMKDKSGKLPIHYAKDDVVKHMILTRMKFPQTEYYRDSMNTHLPKESRLSGEVISEGFSIPQDAPNPTDKREQREQGETQNQSAESEEDHTNYEEDDLIQLEKHGIMVRISKYETYSAKDIGVEVIEDVPPELELKETEAIISVGLKMSPSDAFFESPVRVTMPHCGAFTKPKDAEVYIYYRKNDSTEFTAIHSSSTSSPRCVVRDRDLDIYVNHFSEHWIVAKIRRIFIGKRVVCTPCVPVPAPRNEEHVLLVNVRDQRLAEWRVPDGYKVPIPGEQFLVRWRSGELKISCKAKNIINETETIKESDFRNLTEHQKTFVVDTRNVTKNKVILEFTFQQSTTKKFHIQMRLEETVTVISEGGASSPSPIPIVSPSAGIHPTETTSSDSSPEPRVPRGRGENDFDDILTKIAERINKRTDLDRLGGKLGLEPEETQRYIDTNNKNGDYMGTLQMLRDWRKGTTKSKEHELLRQALVGIKYIRLADELLGVDKLK